MDCLLGWGYLKSAPNELSRRRRSLKCPYHVDRGEAGRVLREDEPPEAAVVPLADAHSEAAAVVVEAAHAQPAYPAVVRADGLCFEGIHVNRGLRHANAGTRGPA